MVPKHLLGNVRTDSNVESLEKFATTSQEPQSLVSHVGYVGHVEVGQVVAAPRDVRHTRIRQLKQNIFSF